MFDTLDAIRDDAAQRLARAASDRRSPMHTPVVATADADLRVMVLRAFTESAWSLRFHTDTRAPKVATVREQPQVGVLFYDKAQKVQLRCRGVARIEPDSATAQAAWEAGSNFARRCYLGDGPGTVKQGAASGLPDVFEGHEPPDEELVPARANFAVLMVEIERLDWLYLAHDGHRRAQFDLATGESRWVTP
ncbi:pyridoxamine 5'-phosphate oxidase family protein [Alteriqipengyuania lutimaris]|uniref:Flavin-binding protein n=1 Tax=Alteriqipengyuania lutimaris TaxID=1538146 RepID=A0A395LLC2_9SPHN|nr:pyridoxamine 5'-phosphate oxidase family protein [Alteriqipengyuania lutimaris]MBB3033157.1 general stress protein 26 [Alteriqipengyuania lutimaris]RDS77788.1 flavin-binding protein [Alteriqipengyuania lutimaris]